MRSCGRLLLFLSQMQTLCRFFRNESYRRRLILKLGGCGLPVSTLLKSFTASFAKWRYETVAECMRQLYLLRELCETFIRRDHFAAVQDEAHLRDVIVACKNNIQHITQTPSQPPT